jgi:hypothetical protein
MRLATIYNVVNLKKGGLTLIFMKLIKIINPEGVLEEEVGDYRVREAGRLATETRKL